MPWSMSKGFKKRTNVSSKLKIKSDFGKTSVFQISGHGSVLITKLFLPQPWEKGLAAWFLRRRKLKARVEAHARARKIPRTRFLARGRGSLHVRQGECYSGPWVIITLGCLLSCAYIVMKLYWWKYETISSLKCISVRSLAR